MHLLPVAIELTNVLPGESIYHLLFPCLLCRRVLVGVVYTNYTAGHLWCTVSQC